MTRHGYHRDEIYPDPATRSQQCGCCHHSRVEHYFASYGFCRIKEAMVEGNDLCDVNAYQEYQHTASELERLEEMTKGGGAFAVMRRNLLKQAAEGERELVEFDKGLVMSPTPGRNVARPKYDGDAA